MEDILAGRHLSLLLMCIIGHLIKDHLNDVSNVVRCLTLLADIILLHRARPSFNGEHLPPGEHDAEHRGGGEEVGWQVGQTREQTRHKQRKVSWKLVTLV